ncbi:lysine-specific demethylase REF6-like [Rhizophagus clarus]|uniref:Lysine-specific demethylase REF6-like n=1 Tax=Rhizophagus clarus TaxID=94130 RepID=A0A8H3R5M7_9GLOM|nr:lysine-specific demethylase REF6-like [Rhizophagus clarus]
MYVCSDAYFADYPKFLAETKLVADELGEDHIWSEIFFSEATEQDKERIKANLSQYTSADVTPRKSSRSHTICLSSERTKATLKRKRLADIEPTSRGKSPVAEESVKAPKDQRIIVYKRDLQE